MFYIFVNNHLNKSSWFIIHTWICCGNIDLSQTYPCKKRALTQEALPALKWGQSWNMTGSFKMLATTDAAITQAICFHFLLEDCVSSTKSLMPLTTTHCVLKSWAAAYTPTKKKHSCLWTIYLDYFLSILKIIVQPKLTNICTQAVCKYAHSRKTLVSTKT